MTDRFQALPRFWTCCPCCGAPERVVGAQRRHLVFECIKFVRLRDELSLLAAASKCTSSQYILDAWVWRLRPAGRRLPAPVRARRVFAIQVVVKAQLALRRAVWDRSRVESEEDEKVRWFDEEEEERFFRELAASVWGICPKPAFPTRGLESF
jgi:hypothetical protein